MLAIVCIVLVATQRLFCLKAGWFQSTLYLTTAWLYSGLLLDKTTLHVKIYFPTKISRSVAGGGVGGTSQRLPGPRCKRILYQMNMFPIYLSQAPAIIFQSYCPLMQLRKAVPYVDQRGSVHLVVLKDLANKKMLFLFARRFRSFSPFCSAVLYVPYY